MAKKQQRAGLIPFYVDGDKILMMFMKPSDGKYGGDEFQIAKGRIEEDENPLAAAVREAHEELGLREENIKWIKKCGLFLNTHHIFMVEVRSMDKRKFDKVTFETGDTIWMELDEFMRNGRKLHRPIVETCHSRFTSRLSGS